MYTMKVINVRHIEKMLHLGYSENFVPHVSGTATSESKKRHKVMKNHDLKTVGNLRDSKSNGSETRHLSRDFQQEVAQKCTWRPPNFFTFH